MEKKIKLKYYEKKLLRLIKGKHKYKNYNNIFDLLGKYYKTVYGLDPLQYPGEFKQCMFNNMFSLLMKIKEPNEDRQILDVFNASFYKGISRDQNEPILRAISELYGQIQCVTVRKKVNDRYVWRFDLY